MLVMARDHTKPFAMFLGVRPRKSVSPVTRKTFLAGDAERYAMFTILLSPNVEVELEPINEEDWPDDDCSPESVGSVVLSAYSEKSSRFRFRFRFEFDAEIALDRSNKGKVVMLLTGLLAPIF